MSLINKEMNYSEYSNEKWQLWHWWHYYNNFYSYYNYYMRQPWAQTYHHNNRPNISTALETVEFISQCKPWNRVSNSSKKWKQNTNQTQKQLIERESRE